MSARALSLAALLLAPALARAADEDFQRFVNAAVRMYENLEYERALEQIRNARRSATTPEQQASTSLYEGVFLADLNRPDDARGAFKEALLLNPDAKLPIKVSPRVTATFETLRAEVKKELAPLLAKQEAEKKRREAEEKAKAEEARRTAEAEARARAEDEKRRKAEADARAAELAKLEAERLKLEQERARLTEEQRKKAEADLKAREAALRAEAERARLEDERRRAEEEQRKAEAARLAQADRPEQRTLVTGPDVRPGLDLAASPPPSRGVPAVPLIFLGAGVAAAGVGAYFGTQAGTLTAAARNEPFQDVAAQHLARAGDQATAANVLYGAAGAMALGALISGVIWAATPTAQPPPPAVTTP